MSRTLCLLTTLIAVMLAVPWPPFMLPTSRAGEPSTSAATTEPNIPQPVELQQGLGSLPCLDHARSRSVCAENPTGTKGKGGMAVPNPSDPSPPESARAADDLGQGWKVRPFLRVNKGATATLMDVDGPGVIQHIWMVEGLSRAHVLRFYWDGEATPSIEVPAPDFFAVGHSKFAPVNSLAVVVNPRNALNCYWPMPFRKHVRITLSNESPDKDLTLLAYQIDYAEREVPANAAYFHAQFRRARTDRQNPYVILDGVRGHGRYVGTFLAWTQRSKGWFGEGEIKFYLDGDGEFPTICGTGTEDYFCGSYGFPRPFSGPYTGTTLPASDSAEMPGYWSLYRWHIMDPICFERDLRVTIQALGWEGKKYKKLSDDIASVAYWYQTAPHAPFPPLPPLKDRMAPVLDASPADRETSRFIYLVRPDFPDQVAMMTFLKRRLTEKDFFLPLPGRGPDYASDLPGQRLYPAGNLEGIKRHIDRVKPKGRSGWIVFDLELPPPNVKVSPELEAAHKNFVKSVESASALTRESGWKFMLTPVYPDIRKYAAQFAPFCDAVVLQVPHSLPDYPGAVRAAVNQIKAVNPKCLVFVQLGPRSGATGMRKVNDDFDGLTRAWHSVHDLVDGILVYYFNEPDPLPGLRRFYASFSPSG